MNKRTMKITASPVENNQLKVGQQVNFINILEGAKVALSVPQIFSYENADSSITALLNYATHPAGSAEPRIYVYNGFAPIRQSDVLTVSVFKQEIGYDLLGNIIPLTPFEQVASDINQFHLRDYNISNNRWYRYVIYPADKDVPLSIVEATIKTAWGGWSITELHPTDSSMKKFSVTSKDVWVFKYNVETGEQTQNLQKNEQITLGQYPRYSLGKQNNISGSVSCLLGSEVVPANYLTSTHTQEGGYREIMLYSDRISSNDKVDMLKGWRNIVYSGNPKILKDRKGQSFLVTLNSGTNKPMDNVRYQPDVINFNWVEMGSVEGLQIIDTSLRGE